MGLSLNDIPTFLPLILVILRALLLMIVDLLIVFLRIMVFKRKLCPSIVLATRD